MKALIRYHEFDLLGTQEGLPEQIDELAAMPGWAYVGVGRDDGRRSRPGPGSRPGLCC